MNNQMYYAQPSIRARAGQTQTPKSTGTGTGGTGTIKDINNNSDLQATISANPGKMVVVKAYMPTCPVCAAYAPTYTQFPSQYPNIVFTQYNAAKPTDLTSMFKLTLVPTTAFYFNGSQTGLVSGLQIAQIKQQLEAHK